MAASAAPKTLADRLSAWLVGWAFKHMDFLFSIARDLFPILLVSYRGRRFALVTRYDDVQEVLSRPNVFDVLYAPKIRLLMDGDNIFLGMHDEPQATRDKANMRVTTPRSEAEARIKPEVERMAEEVVGRANGRVDIAMELTQDVTTRFFGSYFGTPHPNTTTFSDWARLLFKFMFIDMQDDPALRVQVEPVAAQMRRHVENAIAERKDDRGQHDDLLERCLKLQDEGFAGMSDREIRNNLIGCIVGGLPQPPMIIPQLFDVLLERPEQLTAACAAARADDDAQLSRYVFEALRYYPLTPGLFRHCTEDYRVSGGTWRSKIIPKGTTVLAATRSAMFDSRRVIAPAEFRLDRPDYHYMHFGYGMHECFGVYINKVMVPAICKSVLKRKNLRRSPSDAGRLQMDGVFAKRLCVEYEP